MKSFKRILTLAVAAGLLAALAGCKSMAQNATIYIQGELDASYKGTYVQEYLDLVKDMTAADVEEKYDDWTEAETEYLLSFLGMESETPTDEVLKRAQDVVKAIYAKCKYTVSEAEQLKSGDIAVEVTVSPIEIFHLLDDDVFADTWSDVISDAGVTTQEEMDAVSDEDYAAMDMEYVMRLLDEVEKLIPQLTYGKDQSVMLQLKKDDDGYFSLVETGFQKLDEFVIDYNGSYME